MSLVQENIPTAPFYASADSAPAGFAQARSPWITPLFFLAFVVMAAALVWSAPWIKTSYVTAVEKVAGVDIPEPSSLGIRPVFLAFALTLWPFLNGKWAERIKVAFFMSVICFVTFLLVDAFFMRVGESMGVQPFSLVEHIIVGYATLLALMATFLISVRLPGGIRTHTTLRRPRLYLFILIGCLLLSIGIVFALLRTVSTQIDLVKDTALLGGIGPGIPLFSPIFLSLLVIVGTLLRIRRIRNSPRYDCSVGVVVPAYNEAAGIADCIRSLDKMAAVYKGGSCKLYLVDNGSTDNTVQVARDALAQCRALQGEVLICPTRGKAAALNFGVEQTTEDIVVRLDADTVVLPDLLERIIPYFSDPTVGIVGGIPLPKEPSRLLSRMRAIEVWYRIGFGRVAYSALDALLCVPGIQTAYRREALLQAGSFSEGVNGEDTDMTVRIGRLGYRVLIDPNIRVFSEVPATLGHLREQRIRWTRSALHVFARNISAIRMFQGVRGVYLLPFSVWGLFRRMLVLFILIYGVLAAAIDPSVVPPLREGASLGALVVGPGFTLIVLTLSFYRQFGLILFVPLYLGFQVFRTYISIEMLFTLPLKSRVPPRNF